MSSCGVKIDVHAAGVLTSNATGWPRARPLRQVPWVGAAPHLVGGAIPGRLGRRHPETARRSGCRAAKHVACVGIRLLMVGGSMAMHRAPVGEAPRSTRAPATAHGYLAAGRQSKSEHTIALRGSARSGRCPTLPAIGVRCCASSCGARRLSVGRTSPVRRRHTRGRVQELVAEVGELPSRTLPTSRNCWVCRCSHRSSRTSRQCSIDLLQPRLTSRQVESADNTLGRRGSGLGIATARGRLVAGYSRPCSYEGWWQVWRSAWR